MRITTCTRKSDYLPQMRCFWVDGIIKYVASTALQEAAWDASIIEGDNAEEVRKLRERAGRDVVKYGTGSLVRLLFAHDLVDMLCIEVYSFLLGHGRRLFEQVDITEHLHLSDVRRFRTGTVIL